MGTLSFNESNYELFKNAFPFKDIREEQELALYFLEKSFKSDKKFSVLELPTGVGKSGISIALSKLFTTTLATPQKILMDQYLKEFSKDLKDLKGKNAYTCRLNKGKSCDLCKEPCSFQEECPYRIALSEIKIARASLFNFDSFFYQTQYGSLQDWNKQLLIIDEAHNMEEKFINFFTINLLKKEDTNLPIYSQPSQYKEYLQGFSEVLFKNSTRILDDNPNDDNTIREAQRLLRKSNNIATLMHILNDKDFVIEKVYTYNPRSNRSEISGIDIKKMNVGKDIRNSFYNRFEKVILMSATFLDEEKTCKYNGINKNDCNYLTIPSPFSIDNRRIIVSKDTSLSLNKNNLSEKLPEIVGKVKRILEKYPNQRGIIHTSSDKIAYLLNRNLKNNRVILKGSKLPAKDAVKQLSMTDNGVLMGSAMEEGLDLKDDLCRFSIIVKTPFPPYSQYIKKKTTEGNDKDYYTWLAAKKLVQALGRDVRHKDDYSTHYIIDTNYSMLKKFIPDYVKEAILYENF